MEITEALKSNRPNLSASSLKTYSSVLRNLQKNMKGNLKTQIANYIL